ncbi:MAG TPA: helix-turn-helix domain-containing protein [Candidatus Limnocylindrales bacterium]|nr:helix-turn-helix domain-containing protein [Candidatus Limnocylindrales bacterium]
MTDSRDTTTARDDVTAVALLDEPARRAVYDWVVAQHRPVSRDEAAKATGMSRALAAFHLDRLASGGLLETEFRRLTGRTGPGAGRPAKLYRRADRDIQVSLPERRYEVAAGLLADALEDVTEQRPPDALRAAAHRLGEEVGRSARAAAGPRPSRAQGRAALVDTLDERGYEPVDVDGRLRLGNCPFDALVDTHRDLVCGMNLALAEGILDGLGERHAAARLDRQPDLCCVAFDIE